MASRPDHLAPSRKAESVAESSTFRPFSLGKLTCKGLIMDQLEIIDLGDAMTETRCNMNFASTFDSIYGPGRRSC
jgi:hypothetical protein